MSTGRSCGWCCARAKAGTRHAGRADPRQFWGPHPHPYCVAHALAQDCSSSACGAQQTIHLLLKIARDSC